MKATQIIVISTFCLLICLSIALAANPITTIDQAGPDANTYKGTLDYNTSHVTFDYPYSNPHQLTGILSATGLKSDFTYQVKLEGKPKCIYGSSGDDEANEYIGYAGRWTCASCTGTALSKNRDDAQYVANKAKLDTDPTKECIQGYLVFGFFTTDSSGALLAKTLTSDSSYHVLWCNGGTCGLASNSNLNVNGLCAPADVSGEIQRGSCGSLVLAPNTYNTLIALTEESFHQGDWATVLQKDITFEITDSVIPAVQSLDYVDIGDTTSEIGHLDMTTDDWSYIGDSVHNGGGYLASGGYGGYDGGSANFRGLMGPPTGCDPSNASATLTMHAGSNTPTQIELRHLDGSAGDSFDIFVWHNNIWESIGHYSAVANKNPPEQWFTTSYALPSGMTGDIHFKMVATDTNTPWCSLGWGQVMFNWVQLDGYPAPVCGNGIVEGTEQCDDHNTISGDGCSATCQIESTFYRDADGDGYGDPLVTIKATTAPSGYISDDTDCNDAKAAVHPGATEVCNGIDDNCNGLIDEGYVPTVTTCGVGACAATGTKTCVAGVEKNSCTPGTPAANDNTCNGIDDNCNGQIDEGYVPVTSCFLSGACAAGNVASSCVAGHETACTPGTPTTETCNGLDDNCNGLVDDGLTAPVQSCSVGVGACKATGTQTKSCNGVIGWSNWGTCSAVAGTPSTEVWNGIDDDCNGKIDDGIANPACAATLFKDGWANCAVSGNNYGDIGLSCCRVAWDGVNQPCTELNRDATFTVGTDGLLTTKIIINHLDGISDTGDSFAVMDGSTELCRYTDSTPPGVETWMNLECDVNLIGVKTLTIHPLATGPWTQCDAYGQVAVSSITFETAPAPKEVDFNGVCPPTWGVPALAGGVYGGKPYSDFCLVWEPTCAANTESAFVNMAFTGAVDEVITINHLDGMSDLDSFDVLVDNVVIGHYADSKNPKEEWVVTSFPVKVGAGIHIVTLKATDNAWSGCNDWGQLAINYIKVEECTLSTYYRDADSDGYGTALVSTQTCTVPAGYVVDNTDCNDANAAVHPGAIDVCNGVDDDCNAATADGSGESWIDQSTACGVGVCASTGNYVCQAGLKTNTCKEGTPAASDLTCNGLDDDCNGKIDDEYVSLPTTCGVGACAATGIKTCVAGAEQNSCTQGSSTGSDDNCNGIDENCNGVPDDNYVSTSTSCGVGACASSGQLICSNGATQDTCTPGISKPEVWNGLDDDCNGKIDDGIANPDCAATLFKDGWANCAVSGNNYGDIGLSCCRVAWDGVNKPCTELNRDATFTVGTDGLLTTKIVIDHLDGIADTGDGFEVKDGDTVLCSYVGTLPGTEIWKTLTCDVNLIGVKTLTIHPTATSPWTQCDTYGQVAINSITFETAPAPTDVDFKIGDTCPATWGVPAIPGGTYGGKPYTDFCLVWEPTCAAGTESASVNMEFSGVPNELITIEHLDGMSDKDSFDVLVDNVKAGHYTDSGLSIEDWVTTSFPVTVTPGIHTVTLKATDSAWSSCNDWGQIAIDSIKVEGACNLIASYRDSDGDGYGNNVVSSLACTVPAGYVVDNTDCNDANAAVHPGAKDVCNGVDDDCTAATADGSAESWYNQATTCGLGVCAATGNYVCQLGVKTDTCVVGAPTGTDNNCNGVDENCDGTADNAYVPASTTCGTGACAATGTTSCVSGSVQDTCKPGSPTAETCNGLDDDCNGVVDDGLTAPTQSCSVGVGACMNTGTQIKTCNRVNGWSNWGACSAIAGTPGIETCNGIDDDCNSVIDNGVKTTFYRDADSDGYGNPTVKIQACSAPSGYVASKTDCNDANAAIHPGAAEVCNGIDDNCNGLIDDGLTKSASNIQGLCSGNTQTCKAGIWKDTSTNYKPTAEICDNKDNNCNGLVDDGLTRTTHCGLGICSSNTGKETCIAGTWGGNTCNAFAGATTEICDDKDNNCNGKIDESPCTAATYCGNIIIKNMVDISGMLKCQTADWQHNEPGRLPNDCSVHLISSSKVVCVATSNAN